MTRDSSPPSTPQATPRSSYRTVRGGSVALPASPALNGSIKGGAAALSAPLSSYRPERIDGPRHRVASPCRTRPGTSRSPVRTQHGVRRTSLRVVHSPLMVNASPMEREALQNALKVSQDTLREEARRAGAAEALLQERTLALQTASRQASEKQTAKVRRSCSKSTSSTISTLDVGLDQGQGSIQTSLGSGDDAHSELLSCDQTQSAFQQQVDELRCQLDMNTQQLLEVQLELQFANSERDKASLSLADSAKVRAEQQVDLSRLGTEVTALQRDLEHEREASTVARQEAARLFAEKEELEVAFQSYRDHHGIGESDTLRAITDLRMNTSYLSKEVESKTLMIGEEQGRALELQSENKALQQRLAKADVERRNLHNSLQELKGNIRVMCRVRPASDDAEVVLQIQEQNKLCLGLPPDNQLFEFDRVFGPETSQADVFEEVEGLVQSALDGYKVCIFAYGQTGSGKTFTMQGSDAPNCSGIIPRTLEKVLQATGEMRQQGWKWSLQVSLLEVYNEGLCDLLRSGGEAAAAAADHVIIRHDDWGTMVTGMTCVEVTSVEQVLSIMARAARRRSVGATDMNVVSSRSHSIFAMYLTGTQEAQGLEIRGALHLVDLAGSERLDRSGSKGCRLKETQHINRSLATLAHVFTAKAESQAHVPFRNSKLTHLMEPCLSGQGKTLMLVNVQPELVDAPETLCSLRFAQQVARCNTGGRARRGVRRMSSIRQTPRYSYSGGDINQTPRGGDVNQTPQRMSSTSSRMYGATMSSMRRLSESPSQMVSPRVASQSPGPRRRESSPRAAAERVRWR